MTVYRLLSALHNQTETIFQINFLSSRKFNASLAYGHYLSNKIFIKEQSVTRNSRTMVLEYSVRSGT